VRQHEQTKRLLTQQCHCIVPTLLACSMPQCTRPPSSGVLLPLMSVITSLMFLVPRIAASTHTSRCSSKRKSIARRQSQAEHCDGLQNAQVQLLIAAQIETMQEHACCSMCFYKSAQCNATMHFAWCSMFCKAVNSALHHMTVITHETTCPPHMMVCCAWSTAMK
jgi:hypothetical protein